MCNSHLPWELHIACLTLYRAHDRGSGMQYAIPKEGAMCKSHLPWELHIACLTLYRVPDSFLNLQVFTVRTVLLLIFNRKPCILLLEIHRRRSREGVHFGNHAGHSGLDGP